MPRLTRRKMLAGSVPLIGAGAAALHGAVPHSHPWTAEAAEGGRGGHGAQGGGGHAGHTEGHASFRGGAVSNRFDPHEILRDFDWGKTKRLPNGRTLREWEIVAADMEVEVAPGVKFPAWTYNNRIPGPTLRAREGDRMRVTFINGSEHPHTIHWHGIHPAGADGVPGIGAGQIEPGGKTVYEFDAEPFGLHLYHCHSTPLAEHIAKGLYGAFVIDPEEGRPDADELVMVMNGFDTNFDRANEVYAVNTVAFAYMDRPIRVRRGELVRIYLVNVLEFDFVNSFHIHANFFDYYPTGTRLEPRDFTDTVIQGQGERGILELRFPYTGKYMFHAHVSEFAELGWMGFFEVVD